MKMFHLHKMIPNTPVRLSNNVLEGLNLVLSKFNMLWLK